MEFATPTGSGFRGGFTDDFTQKEPVFQADEGKGVWLVKNGIVTHVDERQ